MKQSLRIVALALVALVVIGVGLIPDTLSVQKPRTENISIPVSELPSYSIVLPTIQAPSANTLFTKALTDATDEHHQQPPAAQVIEAPHAYESLELFIHLPPDAAKYQPLRVLIVLHGMGGRGVTFSQSIVGEADKNHWLLIAPTVPYTDYMQPVTLLQEDIRYTGMLADMMNDLPRKLGLKLRQHALVYGFSRGAQLAHRFALFYPERVESVAAISAGTFTLPTEYNNDNTTEPLLKMPYGVGDLGKYVGHTLNHEALKLVSFLIEVGGEDVVTDDVPRQFDPYLGKTRVDRAHAFQNALLVSGVKARLMIFPGAGHEVTNEMQKNALLFLRDEELAMKMND